MEILTSVSAVLCACCVLILLEATDSMNQVRQKNGSCKRKHVLSSIE